MKGEAKKNLEFLFRQNFSQIKGCSLEEIFDGLISDESKGVNLNTGEVVPIYDENEIRSFRKAKKNKVLVSAFERAKRMDILDQIYIDFFKKEIVEAIRLVEEQVMEKKPESKCQVIFLEYDWDYVAYLSGYGEGRYPILEKQEYFEFNFKDEVFGAGKISYSKLWEPFVEFETLLEKESIDAVHDTDAFAALTKAYQFKTYLLLFAAFDQLGEKLFSNIPVKKPLYVFGNEHDCEKMNVYIFD